MTRHSASSNPSSVAVTVALLVMARAGVAVAEEQKAVAQEQTVEQRADALFYEARALVVRGQYAEACPMFERARDLRPGIGTLLNLGDCYERLGRFASASSVFEQAVALAREADDPRVEIALSRVQLLAPKVRHLTVSVESDPGRMVISINGTPLGAEHWGRAQARDRGKYAVEASAPGMQSWRTELTIGDVDQSVRVPSLKPIGTAAVHGATPTRDPAVTATADEPQASPVHPAHRIDEPSTASPGSSFGKTSVLVLGGVGVVGAAVGAVFGLRALASHDTVAEHCVQGPNRDECPEGGDYDELSEQSVADGNVATTAFVISGVALAGAATLWILDDGPQGSSTPAIAVSVQPGWATLRANVVGRW